MTCPDWTTLAARRDIDDEGERAWRDAVAHLEGCEPCRAAAYEADPLLVFHRLPAPETGAAEIADMKRAVHTLRRAHTLSAPTAEEAAPRRSANGRRARWAMLRRAAAFAVVLVGAAVVFGPRIGPPEVVPAGDPTPAVALVESVGAPPKDLHFEIRVLRAETGALAEGSDPLPEELAAKLRGLLRYDGYQVLAASDLSAQEGEAVASALGTGYDVSFRPGAVFHDQRLRLEDFRLEKTPVSANKGRRLEPRQLVQATLDLKMEQPLTLILTEDPSRPDEVLVVAITCRFEDDDDPGEASEPGP